MITLIESIPQDGESTISVEINTGNIIYYNCIPTEIFIHVFQNFAEFEKFFIGSKFDSHLFNIIDFIKSFPKFEFMAYDYDLFSKKVRLIYPAK